MSDSYTGLFASDIHMNNNLPHAKPTLDGRTDRMDDQIKLWGRFAQVAEKVHAQHFWVPGDLFDHGRLDAVTNSETARVMAEFPIPVNVVPGNHDAHTIRGGRFNLEAFGHLSRGHIRYLGGRPSTPVQVNDWLTFWPLEFMPAEETRAALHDIREQIKDGLPKTKGKRVDVLLMHNSILHCTHVGWVCDDGLSGDEVCEGFDYVISGHFHDYQKFGPDGRGMYLGAPMHHRYDDAGRRAGFWAMTFNRDGSRSKKFYDGKAPRFHNADWVDGEPVLCDDEELVPGDYLKIKVEATYAEWTLMRPEVLAAEAELNRQGVRATSKHIPQYHHATRLKTHDGMEMASMETNIAAYPDSPEVDITGLDLGKLKAIGRAALDAARRSE